jgi:hypothetical protein
MCSTLMMQLRIWHCRTLIHDNLTLHHAPEVYKAVKECCHRVICRLPYHSQDGLVEYAINQVCTNLVKCWSKVKDLKTMKIIIEKIINEGIHSMDETFLHCTWQNLLAAMVIMSFSKKFQPGTDTCRYDNW